MNAVRRWLTGQTTTTTGRLLAALILLGLGLRLARLAFQPLWWDEGWSLYFATTGAGRMLALTAVDIHPPLYYLLLHLWIQLFGSSVLAVRLLSVLIGTAALPLLYLSGKQLGGRRLGLLATCLLAISPLHIYYSQEVRMYGLVMLLGLAALYFALRWAVDRSTSNWKWGLGYVLAATAALYTQYYAAFLLLALNLVVLLGRLPSPRGRSHLADHSRQRVTDRSRDPPAAAIPPSSLKGGRRVPWLGAQGAVALLYLPWVWYAADKLLTYVRFKVGVEADPSLGPLTYLGRHLAAFTWGHAEGYLAGWWWLGLLPLAILGLLLLISARRKLGRLVIGHWPLVILLVMLIFGFAINLALPFNPPRLERQLLLALPAFLLLVAAGLLALWRESRLRAGLSLAAILAIGIWSLALFYAVPRYPDDDYRPLAEQLRALALPSDVVVNVHPWQVGYFRAYLPDDEARPNLYLTPREVIPRERQLWADDPARMAAELDDLLAGHDRLWFADHRVMGRVLESQIEAHLVQHAYPTLSEWHGENTVLSLFAAGEPEGQPVTAVFGNWLALNRTALGAGRPESGWGVVAVDLDWLLDRQPADEYTVGLRLVGATGHVWAQRDSPPRDGLAEFGKWPPGETLADRHGLLVPAGTPPGDYRVTLRVYRTEDQWVLPTGSGEGELSLGTVRVARPERATPVEALDFRWSVDVQFGDRLRLLGYNNYVFEVLPGETVDVDLFWQALAEPGEDFLPRLQLILHSDQVVAESVQKPVAGTYPTAWWKPGELVRDPQSLPITAEVPPGYYTLALSLVRAADGQPIEIGGGQTWVGLGDISVTSREHNYEPPSPEYVQLVQLGSSVALVGYQLSETGPTPGSVLDVQLYWHALETPDRNYHSFAHLLDAEDTIVAQDDGVPGAATLGWLPGEYLSDDFVIQLPANLPAGTYRLGVGLYEPATGLRLGERILLDTAIQVTGNQ